MLRLLTISIALVLASTALGTASASAAEVVYDCYDEDGRLRQRGVSRGFALGYLGYSSAAEEGAGPLRSRRGTCLPQGVLPEPPDQPQESTQPATLEPAAPRQQEFGLLPGVGEFRVLQDTYQDLGPVRQFEALVNGDRQRWWANCRTSALGTDRQALPTSEATRAVHRFVCSDPR